MILPIKLDLDGVAVDFVTPSLLIHGRLDLVADPTFPAVYDYWEQMGLTAEEFWKPIREAGPDWWKSLPNYKWTPELLELVARYDPNFQIATKPVDAGGCAAKWDWRAQYAPKQRLHITTDKIELCKPGHVLIDDAEGNIDAWNKAGGYGVLFPATYNSNRHLVGSELAYVANRLLDIHQKHDIRY